MAKLNQPSCLFAMLLLAVTATVAGARTTNFCGTYEV